MEFYLFLLKLLLSLLQALKLKIKIGFIHCKFQLLLHVQGFTDKCLDGQSHCLDKLLLRYSVAAAALTLLIGRAHVIRVSSTLDCRYLPGHLPAAITTYSNAGEQIYLISSGSYTKISVQKLLHHLKFILTDDRLEGIRDAYPILTRLFNIFSELIIR